MEALSAARFRSALAAADTDTARRQLAAAIIALYRVPIEGVLHRYWGRELPMRRVAHIRISRGVREHGACFIRRGDDTSCVLSFSRHLFFSGVYPY